MEVIKYPNSCDEGAIFDFCSSVWANRGIDKLLIDFSAMGRIEPFTMVYVAKSIREFNRENVDTTVSCVGHKDKDYAANMAFFRAFGLKHGREPGATDGNARFVPFTILRTKTVRDEASREWEVVQEIVERRSKQLAQILSQEERGNTTDALTFSIREIIRNVFEHSESRHVDYCAQYWPSYHKVEIAIADSGIGLRQSLAENPYVETSTDSDAIQQALMPAISSKNYRGALVDTDDPWHNSGFGLYMISRMCRLGGEFLICSGDHGIRLDDSGKTHVELGHHCSGTAVRMILNTERLGDLKGMLAKFRDDGHRIAKHIKGSGVYTASAASQMLSGDFA